MADIIEKIEEGVEKGAEAIEEIVEKVEEGIEKVEEIVKGDKKKKGRKKKISEESEKETEVPVSEESESLEEKRKKLLERAKKLKEKVSEEVSSEELKEKVKIKKKADMLIPLEEYVKAGIYLGTKVVTPNMRPFVYRRRADGLAIFNTDLIDEKLKEGIEYLSKFNPEDVIVVCKREVGWRTAMMFSQLTGIRFFTKKYPAGVLTNTRLPDFFENELTIVTDSWLDRNALNDTIKVKKKVLMICDTNNFAKGADKIIIGNNKSEKSLGVIFYLLARGYCKNRGLPTENIPDLEWWTGEEKEIEIERKISAAAGSARYGV